MPPQESLSKDPWPTSKVRLASLLQWWLCCLGSLLQIWPDQRKGAEREVLIETVGTDEHRRTCSSHGQSLGSLGSWSLCSRSFNPKSTETGGFFHPFPVWLWFFNVRGSPTLIIEYRQVAKFFLNSFLMLNRSISLLDTTTLMRV